MTSKFNSKVSAVFGDEVMVSFMLKKSRDGDEKDGMIRIAFMDTARKEVISDVILSPITAKALGKMLLGATQKLDDALAGKKIEGLRPAVKKQEETTYIG